MPFILLAISVNASGIIYWFYFFVNNAKRYIDYHGDKVYPEQVFESFSCAEI